MASARKWSNVIVSMQSAIAAAKTITAITLANPGVATSTAHGFTNGQIVYMLIQGMYQLNERPVRVANVTANTFELEGIDTTLFPAFTSGSAALVTLGTSITSATSISASGGDFDLIDTTTIHAGQRSQIPGLPNASSFSFDNIWDVSDAGLLAMKAAGEAQAQRVFLFQFGASGQKFYFAGYVNASLLPTGQAQQLVTTPAVITMNGFPSVYAT
jgi:hypothetical protein